MAEQETLHSMTLTKYLSYIQLDMRYADTNLETMLSNIHYLTLVPHADASAECICNCQLMCMMKSVVAD